MSNSLSRATSKFDAEKKPYEFYESEIKRKTSKISKITNFPS